MRVFDSAEGLALRPGAVANAEQVSCRAIGRGVAREHRKRRIRIEIRHNAYQLSACRYKIHSTPTTLSAPARGIIMLIFLKRVPLAIRRDIVVACLRACIWARVEGRPFCLIQR